tara:strand:- start:1907 stop:2872 length:966 start_codon:yes stop_codon:yes gene_type:complete
MPNSKSDGHGLGQSKIRSYVLSVNANNNSETIGLIEGGGTKFILAVASTSGLILKRKTIKTELPDATLRQIFSFFDQFESLVGFGCGIFGPLNLDKNSPNFGIILNTPKPKWSGVNIKRMLEKRYSVSVFIETDVNTAALGCYHLRDLPNSQLISYITIGTGIGIGNILNGEIVRGQHHNEAGHSIIHHAGELDSQCPFHENCVEGLASGSAFKKNFGDKGKNLAIDELSWSIEIKLLAQFIYNQICFVTPDYIFLGGGLISEKIKTPLINHIIKINNGYLTHISQSSLNCKIQFVGNKNYALFGAFKLATANHSKLTKFM